MVHKFKTIYAAIVLCGCVHSPVFGQETDNHRSVLADDEAVFMKALELRAQEIERHTPFRFSNSTHFTTQLAHRIGNGNAIAEYRPDTQTFLFPLFLTYEKVVQYKMSFHDIDPATLAHDASLTPVLDHELGHALADQVSRKFTGLPFYASRRFMEASRDEQLGLNIVSEGIGTYFETVLHTREGASPLMLPESLSNAPGYSFEMVAMSGGLWVVQDALNQYGEEALAWFVTHPLVATDDLRAAATTYRERALQELRVQRVEQRRKYLETLVFHTRKTLYVTAAMGVLELEEHHAMRLNGLAYTQPFPWENNSTIYVVLAPTALLMEAPDLVLEHIAVHETCHVARRDESSTWETEHGTELCVRTTVGDKRYRSFIEAVEAWQPHDHNLAMAKQSAVKVNRMVMPR